MTLLKELATQVLLGTERRPPVLPPISGALGELLATACPADTAVEVRVLRAAGAVAICADAGFVPCGSGEDLPAPCPPDDLPFASEPALVAALRTILDEGPDPLRHEALQRLAAKGLALSPALLPDALSLGQKTAALRAALLPVLGQRGCWLARRNPAWSYAEGRLDAAPDPSLWDHGTLEQRTQFLGKLRAAEPERACGLVREALPELDARERSALLAQLATGLGPADEDLLEGALADRSKEVRQLAANLLAQLPGSRYATRMAARMSACLRTERKLFRQVWVLDAPEHFGADWKDDALEESRAKSESLGERAWWLYQIARALPLAWWPAHTGLSSAKLIEWSQGTDWNEALLRAWGEAFRRRPASDWAAAFLAEAPPKGLALEVFELLACLPVAEREPHWLHMLEAGPRSIARGELLVRIAQAVRPGEVLSAAFSRRVLGEIRGLLTTDQGKWDYALRKSLPDFICLIPPACLAEAIEGWPTGRPDTEYFSETLARVLAIVEQRKTLHRFL